MSTGAPTQDTFRQMVRAATFYVVDTEYTAPHPDDDVDASRIISIAVQPVIAGRLVSPLYVEMNPTVDVSPATERITGFTTAGVKRKRPFPFYAQRILDAFASTPGVFVSHTTVDLHVLKGELERCARDHDGYAPEDLPDMAIIDTAQLARIVDVPNLPATTGTISLANLCELLAVDRNPKRAHNASYDARITAKALLRLLRLASKKYVDLPDLLGRHARGNTATAERPPRITSAPDTHPVLPDEHLRAHGLPILDDQPDPAEQAAFGTLAAACVANRCQHLDDEARAATAAAPLLLDPLWALLPGCTEPGQAGTLLGAVRILLPDAVPSTKMLTWWAARKQALDTVVRCGQGTSDACPHCRTCEPCPIDVLYTTVAAQAALCGQPTLTKQTVKYKLFSAPGKKDCRVRDWSARHPELAGYMAAMVIDWERDNSGARLAAKYLTTACETYRLHLIEPRLTLMWAEHLAATGNLDEATTLATTMLTRANTDDAYAALTAWLARVEQHKAVQARHGSEPVAVLRPRLARPSGHRHPNPFRVYPET